MFDHDPRAGRRDRQVPPLTIRARRQEVAPSRDRLSPVQGRIVSFSTALAGFENGGQSVEARRRRRQVGVIGGYARTDGAVIARVELGVAVSRGVDRKSI